MITSRKPPARTLRTTVAATVLPRLHHPRRHDLYLRRAVFAHSALVDLASAYWPIEQTLFGG